MDTCCIDKSSSSELSEAINSMFRWYKNSNICYAYLSDVSVMKPGRERLIEEVSSTTDGIQGSFTDEVPRFWDEVPSVIDEVPSFIDEYPEPASQIVDRGSSSMVNGVPEWTISEAATFGHPMPESEVEIPDFTKDEAPKFVMKREIMDWIEEQIPNFEDEVSSLEDMMQDLKTEEKIPNFEDEVPRVEDKMNDLMTEKENFRIPKNKRTLERTREAEEQPEFTSNPESWQLGRDPRPDYLTELLDEDFAKSRWFTRGWTLQKLIAPSSITFYASNWVRLDRGIPIGWPNLSRTALGYQNESCFMITSLPTRLPNV